VGAVVVPPLPISFFFFVYNDERTVRTVAEKASALLESQTSDYEIIIVDDGSPDKAGEVADQLARERSCIRVKNILAIMRDVWRIYRKVFSDQYDLPRTRSGDR
jgi:cellulose synthase/poly-beta-1,6-N-acetylglucosamine synthase-like glycosyltransferase